jgi:hypothetical protein
MCMRTHVDVRERERAEKGGTITRQQRTVLFKCENLKMGAATQTRVRERENKKGYVLAFS